MRRQHRIPDPWFRPDHNVFRSRLGKPVPDAYRVQVARWLLRLLCTTRVETDKRETPHILETVGLTRLQSR